MRLAVGEDEWYPVFTLCEENSFEWKYHLSEFVEITEKEYKDYKETMNKFEEWQSKINNLERVNK